MGELFAKVRSISVDKFRKNERSRTLAAGTFQPKPYHNRWKISTIRCSNIRNVHKRNRFKAVPGVIFVDYFCGMISNQLNRIDGIDPETDALKKLGNRIKLLRMKADYHHYEKFAGQHDIGRILLRRVELGG